MSSTAILSHDAGTISAAADQPLIGTLGPLPVFSADAAGDDRLDRGRTAAHLGQVMAHAEAGTPFLVALYGPAGSGKTTLLGLSLDAVAAYGKPAQGGGARRPFVSDIVIARIEAQAGSDPVAAIVAGVFAGLSTPYPHLAEDALHAGGDPLKAARAAGERVNDLRRTLDRERQTLDETSGRRARLVDSVLFEATGSNVDAYARSNRTRIESKLRGFGLPTTDPVQTYKELVREAAEAGVGPSRFVFMLRALWGFRGQATLLIFAFLLLILGLLCGSLADNPDGLNAWVDGLGDRFAGLSLWVHDHEAWLSPIGHAVLGMAVLCLLVAIFRALLFIQPIFRGASLLEGDLDSRSRDLDSLLAHQARRVDHLAAEVEAAVALAEAAERRAEARRLNGKAPPHVSLGTLDPSPSPYQGADAFFSGLSAAMGGSAGPAPNLAGAAAAPGRIVVAIDGLDLLAPEAAAAYVETAYRLLGKAHFVTLVAVQRNHLAAGFSETDPALAAARIDRCVQLSYDLGAEALPAEVLVNRWLGPAGRGPSETGRSDRPKGQRGSMLDAAWKPIETALVQALAPFAAATPRSLKRFVNTFRVARADPRLGDATPAEIGGLALALALDGSGLGTELSAWDEAETAAAQGAPADGDLARALAVARDAAGVPFTLSQARHGLHVARSYSQRG